MRFSTSTGEVDIRRTRRTENAIFLSHSSSDKPFVRFVAEELTVCKHQVWLDEKRLRAGDLLKPSLAHAIRTSAALLLFFSKDSARSQWVQYEIDLASQPQSKESKERAPAIIPCLVGDVESADLTPVITSRVFVDFRDPGKYEIEMTKLLSAIATPATRSMLPSFDGDSADRYTKHGQDDNLRVWLVRNLEAATGTRKDQTERYWMYVTLARLAEAAIVPFLERALETEVGFAQRGAQEALLAIRGGE